MSERNIVRYKLNPKKARGLGGSTKARLDAMTDEDIERAAAADPDAPLLTEEELDKLLPIPNPRSIREAQGMTQEEFAETYKIPLKTLQDWEQLRRMPDQSSQNYLRVIEKNPAIVQRSLQQELASSDSAPKGTFIGTNVDVNIKLDDLQVAALHNAERLIEDAIKMYEFGSYPTACFLAITAMEEFSKVVGIALVKINTDYYKREGERIDKVVDRWFEDHAVKLKAPAFIAASGQGIQSIGREEFFKWLERTENGALWDLRNRALYTGEWKKRVMEPEEQATEEDAFREISMALELAAAAIDNFYYRMPISGKIRDSQAYLEKERKKERLRRRLANFQKKRHQR